MITADQFTNLPDDLLMVFSSREDGTVLDRTGRTDEALIKDNRQKICIQAGVAYEDMVFQKIVYASERTYDVLVEVDDNQTLKHIPYVEADALFTASTGVGLFLPVADCIVTVLYDPIKHHLAQLHMGRHSTLSNLLQKTIDTFIKKGSDPATILVWMAPSITKASYKLEYFDQIHNPKWRGFYEQRNDGIYIDMQGYNQQRLIEHGILPAHITISAIDTAKDDNYFSYFSGDTGGRFAGLAMMR